MNMLEEDTWQQRRVYGLHSGRDAFEPCPRENLFLRVVWCGSQLGILDKQWFPSHLESCNPWYGATPNVED